MQTRRFLVRATAWLAIAGLCGALCSPPKASAGDDLNKVVASVDGDPITLHDVRSFAAQSGVALPAGDLTHTEVFKDAVKGLIAQKLLEQETKKYADKIDESQVDRYIQDLEREKGISEQQLRQSLMASGVSYDDFRQNARLELEKGMMLNDELRQKIAIPNSEIQAYYDTHKDEFTVKKERYRLAQVLIAVPADASPGAVAAARAKAEEVRKKAIAGQDFGELAKQYSDDESKSQGGELGYFAPDEIMDKILEAAKNLKPGQISEVVQSSHGFHVLKLEAHDVPGPKPLALVKEEIRSKLIDQTARQRLEHWVETDLVKQHYVETMY